MDENMGALVQVLEEVDFPDGGFSVYRPNHIPPKLLSQELLDHKRAVLSDFCRNFSIISSDMRFDNSTWSAVSIRSTISDIADWKRGVTLYTYAVKDARIYVEGKPIKANHCEGGFIIGENSIIAVDYCGDKAIKYPVNSVLSGTFIRTDALLVRVTLSMEDALLLCKTYKKGAVIPYYSTLCRMIKAAKSVQRGELNHV